MVWGGRSKYKTKDKNGIGLSSMAQGCSSSEEKERNVRRRGETIDRYQR